MIDDIAGDEHEERLGWRTLRRPPSIALVFGAIYGAVLGAIVVWDVAVLLRSGKILRRRVSKEMDEHRHGHD